MRCSRRISQAIRWVVVVAVLGALPHRADAQGYYAHWHCSSSQCASVMGKSAGTAGPFGTQNTCDAWRQAYISSSYCNQSPSDVGGGGHVSPDVATFYMGILGALGGSFGGTGPNARAEGTMGGAGALTAVALMFTAKNMSKPADAVFGGVAGGLMGAAVGYYNKGLTAPVPQATVAKDAEIGGGAGVLLGLGLGALKGSELRSVPRLFRALGHLQVATTARRLGLNFAW